MRLSIEACSNKGCVRSNNEDNLYINGKTLQKKKENYDFLYSGICEKNQQMYAVCDGMGGTDYGEVASMAAVKALSGMQKDFHRLPFDKEWLKTSIISLNQRVYHSLRKKSSSTNGGTTIACVCIDKQRFVSINIGDSRIYLLRKKRLYRLSKDHTEVQRMVDLGFLTPQEAENHPQKHVITKHLGMAPKHGEIEATQSKQYRFRRNDVVILCSDGLHDMLSEDSIRNIVLNGGKASQLVDAALDAGGFDNITVITLHVESPENKFLNFRRNRRSERCK